MGQSFRRRFRDSASEELTARSRLSAQGWPYAMGIERLLIAERVEQNR